MKTQTMIRATVAAATLLTAALAVAETQPYARQQDRAISSLSDEDVAQLRAGAGWGLAKPAELNGWPGPRHVLDAAEEIGLTAAQTAEIEAIVAEMQEAAIAAGDRYMAAEAAVDAAFRAGDATAELVAVLTAEAGAALAALRAVHLNAHLATTPLLTRHQKTVYARVRGYADDGGHGHSGHTDH